MPLGRRIAVMTVAQRLHRRLDDVVGGTKVRLPDAQVDDRASLRLQRLRPRQHLERRLRPQPPHPRRQLHHRLAPESLFIAPPILENTIPRQPLARDPSRSGRDNNDNLCPFVRSRFAPLTSTLPLS